MSAQLYGIIVSIVDFYIILIIIYVLMSWVPLKGVFADIYDVLGTITEPYLGIFRRLIPPIGGTLDISPIVAILVLNVLMNLLRRAL